MSNHKCGHQQTTGFHIPSGVCPDCGRDLDLWAQFKILQEECWKLWLKNSAMGKTISPCCKVPLTSGKQTNMWHCSKCGSII